jgi:hypothetical protein
MCEAIPSSQPEPLPRFLPPITDAAWVVRLLTILCCGIALGACSKCDMPDLGRWGSPPHACHDGPSQQ